MAATRRTSRLLTSPAARPGSFSSTRASRCTRSTADRRACSSRTSTSGRAPSGYAVCGCRHLTSPAFGDERIQQLRRSMAGTAVLGRLTWKAAEVVDVVVETRHVKTITFNVPDWPGHRAGQHVDIRLTAEDGYQAERSYSIASAPDGSHLGLTVVRIDDGEVSPYLTDELRPGDQIELRGPIGGYFVWEPAQGGPLLLVAGGSGIAPLMAMIRLRAAADDDTETRLLYSTRSQDDVIYRDELERLSGNGLTVVHTLTDSQPPGWTGYARRVDP